MNTNFGNKIDFDKTEEKDGYSTIGIAGLITLFSGFAFLFSWIFFLNQSLRLDEAQSLWQTSHSVTAMMSVVAEDVHVPLYHVMLHYWQIIFGNGVSAERIMSLIFFILLVPATYLLGKQIHSRAVGIFGALMVAISPFMNWYGNEIRMYTLFALFTVLNQYFFVRIFTDDRDSTGAVSNSVWIGHALTAVIGMFTHYFFAFNLIAQTAFLFYV